MMATNLLNPPEGQLHHSDRGGQYASHAYQALLRKHGMVCSMSRKGNCWGSAPTERFLSSLKREWLTGGTPFPPTISKRQHGSPVMLAGLARVVTQCRGLPEGLNVGCPLLVQSKPQSRLATTQAAVSPVVVSIMKTSADGRPVIGRPRSDWKRIRARALRCPQTPSAGPGR